MKAWILTLTIMVAWSGGIPAQERRNEGELEKRYEQMLKESPRLRQAIESGRVTKEQILERLRGDRGERNERRGDRPDPRAALRKKLGELVEAGKLTREEAGGLFRIAFPEGGRAMSAERRRDYRNRRRMEVKDPKEFGKNQEKPVFSGPQPGEKLPTLKAIGLSGDLNGKQVDPVALAEGKPQLLLIMNSEGVGVRGAFGLAEVVNNLSRKAETDLHTSIVFLGDDQNAIRAFTGRLNDALQNRFDLIALSPDGRDGPGNYGLNRNVAQTIIFAKGGKVMYNFVFPQGMLLPDPHVLGALAEAVGKDRDTVAGWLNEMTDERGRMRRERD